MNNNGMTFGLEGPTITGWWVNPKTGDKFNAVDTFFEDNNLVIKTADGRVLNYNQIQNYIQTNNPDSITVPQTNKQTTKDTIPANILAEIDNHKSEEESPIVPDDDIWDHNYNNGLGNIYHNEKSSETKDYDIINRALNNKSTIELKGDIIWKSFPKREIEMLMEVMNIPEEDIIQYFIDSVSLEDVKKSVQDSIRRYIESILHPTQDSDIKQKSSKLESSGVTKKVVERKPKTKIKK